MRNVASLIGPGSLASRTLQSVRSNVSEALAKGFGVVRVNADKLAADEINSKDHVGWMNSPKALS